MSVFSLFFFIYFLFIYKEENISTPSKTKWGLNPKNDKPFRINEFKRLHHVSIVFKSCQKPVQNIIKPFTNEINKIQAKTKTSNK